jgi:hypothetical protein
VNLAEDSYHGYVRKENKETVPLPDTIIKPDFTVENVAMLPKAVASVAT